MLNKLIELKESFEKEYKNFNKDSLESNENINKLSNTLIDIIEKFNAIDEFKDEYYFFINCKHITQENIKLLKKNVYK